MKRLFLFVLAAFLSACSNTTHVEFDNSSKTVAVLTENYHITNVSIVEIRDNKRIDSIYSSVDVDQPLKKISLLNLEGVGKLYGQKMSEILKRPYLQYRVILQHDQKEFPLYVVAFTSKEVDAPVVVFESE